MGATWGLVKITVGHPEYEQERIKVRSGVCGGFEIVSFCCKAPVSINNKVLTQFHSSLIITLQAALRWSDTTAHDPRVIVGKKAVLSAYPTHSNLGRRLLLSSQNMRNRRFSVTIFRS